MPIIDIQLLSKLYYSIGEVSKFLDVNPSLLRFWEKEFQLEVSKKNKKGNRLFTKKEIEKINKIYHFVKVEGYTLEGAKKALKLKEVKQENNNEKHPSNEDLINRLEAIKLKLVSFKNS
ncbi:MAG: MerR family transcriptional regulator [Bacteroidetes bacterium]|nr:MerR family transcriptional regulator [Bacteroidota bacterium]